MRRARFLRIGPRTGWERPLRARDEICRPKWETVAGYYPIPVHVCQLHFHMVMIRRSKDEAMRYSVPGVSGIWADTVVPAGEESMVMVPANWATRSRMPRRPTPCGTSGDMPWPRSETSTRTAVGERERCTLAALLPEW